MTFQQTADSLRRQADAHFAQYPQYRGFHDEWVAARVTRRLAGKGGLQADRDEIVLASPYAEEDARVPELTGLRTFYSTRLGWHCMARPDAIVLLTTPATFA